MAPADSLPKHRVCFLTARKQVGEEVEDVFFAEGIEQARRILPIEVMNLVGFFKARARSQNRLEEIPGTGSLSCFREIRSDRSNRPLVGEPVALHAGRLGKKTTSVFEVSVALERDEDHRIEILHRPVFHERTRFGPSGGEHADTIENQAEETKTAHVGGGP